MKKIIIFLTILLFSTILSPIAIPEKHIVIVIASYNNEKWCDKNMSSALDQEYDNYDIIYINDVSKDKTAELVQQYIKKHDVKQRVTFINNSIRVGAMANYYNAIHSCKDEDIIIMLDGDDHFAHKKVLAYINAVYSDPSIWLTYGQFKSWPQNRIGFCREFPERILNTADFRNYYWISTHLRTFYGGLFKKVRKEDLLYEGKFYPVAWDLAMLFPMLEMANGHFRFISDVLYIYNDANPLNDSKSALQLQQKLDNHIRALPTYEKIDSPFC